MVKRDEEVFELIHKTYGIPIAMLLGGGYHVSILVYVTGSANTLHVFIFACLYKIAINS